MSDEGTDVVIALAVVGVVIVGGGGEPACTQRLPGVRPGICLGEPASRPAAPTTEVAVLGGEGDTTGVPALVGDVVVMNFWASWCGPCRREQPALNDAAAELAPLGVTFLGVNVQDDSEANALAHEEEFAIPYPSLFDPSARYAASFAGVGPRTLPSTVLLDRQGRVAVSLFGETDFSEVVTLARLLAEES